MVSRTLAIRNDVIRLTLYKNSNKRMEEKSQTKMFISSSYLENASLFYISDKLVDFLKLMLRRLFGSILPPTTMSKCQSFRLITKTLNLFSENIFCVFLTSPSNANYKHIQRMKTEIGLQKHHQTGPNFFLYPCKFSRKFIWANNLGHAISVFP